jgi:uncharacterized protein YjiS (DUF1127 family)
MTRSSPAAFAATAAPRSRSLTELAGTAFAAVWTWRFRARSRSQLADLEPRMMRDIGIDPLDLEREIAKPFWRP